LVGYPVRALREIRCLKPLMPQAAVVVSVTAVTKRLRASFAASAAFPEG
jgi:hypothetical protein